MITKMSKIYARILTATLVWFAANVNTTAVPTPAEQPSTLDQVLGSHITARVAVGALGVELVLLAGTPTGREILKNHGTPQRALLTLIREYLSQWVVTAAHEGAHASAAYAFTGSFPPLSIGSSSNTQNWLEAGPIGLNGFHPQAGRTVIAQPLDESARRQAAGEAIKRLALSKPELATALAANPSQPSQEAEQALRQIFTEDPSLISSMIDKKKTALIYAAGGIGGLAANALCKWSLGDKLGIDHRDVPQLLNLLVPAQVAGGSTTDAAVALKQFTPMSQELLASLAGLSQCLDLAAELPLLFYQANPSKLRKLNAADIVGIALINYATRSFFRIRV